MKRIDLYILAAACFAAAVSGCRQKKDYVDYVDPYIGNISHILVPTYPTVQLPNSMLRVYPERKEHTSEYVNGLPVVVTNHREKSAFGILPSADGQYSYPFDYNYDNEHITPYSYDVQLSDNTMWARFAPSHQSAVYEIVFGNAASPSVALYTEDGGLSSGNGAVAGYQNLPGSNKVYVYLEPERSPDQIEGCRFSGRDTCIIMRFAPGTESVKFRYGVSYISCSQAEDNLRREIKSFDVDSVAESGRRIWNETLSRIRVKGATEQQKTLLYSSYYRTFERPVCISENGRYYSAYDHMVHDDEGVPFYVDDWLWDTYRAAHPLRGLTDGPMQEDILASFLRMARQMGNMWMPTFPEVTGDSRRMNSNHGAAVVAESMALGLEADYAALYEACAKGVDEKTLAPWSASPAGWIDEFYKENGFIPALRPGEKETDPNVNEFEKRQPVAVTLGTAYDQWCLARIAQALGLEEEAEFRDSRALDYRNLFNYDTKFFHPKDKDGNFIEPLDYDFCGGLGGREYYGENNGWVYRWDVPHNVEDLICMMGGAEEFCNELDRTFATPLGRGKYAFYAMLPDHTGNVGQFSMANEPSLHIPYLYNYAGKPWKTQKRIRQMLETWFRTDLMGFPGDEDGGGMSSFVVFSMMGFYPVAPGSATYSIGSPVFPEAAMTLSNGRQLRIIANNVSKDNKYIIGATLDGKPWNKPWFSYDDIRDGAVLEFEMSCNPDKSWGI
ncbi:MAG: GH92 family glycosyl hydrolase [Bacteroidales bacterium]|nr:GH92 family glycosyl hydrolase [Bacteroidales bacterium]